MTPATIFTTERCVIIRKPKRAGLEDIEEYRYDDITNVRFEKGMASSKLVFGLPGGALTFKGKDDYYEKDVIGGLSKKDSEEIY